MISEIQIENFKSISKLSLKPGNVTVLIGENGSGKSNILEAITFAAAASADKLDDEFLFNRGIRVTEKDWMTSAIESQKTTARKRGDEAFVGRPIQLKIAGENSDDTISMEVFRLKDPVFKDDWLITHHVSSKAVEEVQRTTVFSQEVEDFEKTLSRMKLPIVDAKLLALSRTKTKLASQISAEIALRDFLIYAPENSVLRRFEEEGAIKPLGPKGEGLLKLLETTSIASNGEFAAELKLHLNLLGWFGDLQLPTEADEMKGRLRIRDRWLSEDAPFFDQRSANEGFLYLLFYFTLLLSPRTPRFFAIDNIDNALNPKLCAELMRQIAVLAAEKGKQVICTTHNPAILDGLNLHDDRQRLYVVRRDSEGHTVANRVQAPRPRPDGASVPLSTAFMSGLLGGLPDHF
jgi:predicted ATPase